MARRKLPNVLNTKQADAILEQPNVRTQQGLRARCIMETLYRAGLRISELCDLRPEDVDLENDVIRVIAGKGDKDRLVPISPLLKPWLQRWFMVRPPEGRKFFATVRGGVVEPHRHALWVVVKTATVKAAEEHPLLNIDPSKISCHTWRHTAATEMLRGSGGNLVMVQKFLGHSSVTTTCKYTHLNVDDIATYMRSMAPA